MRMQQRIAYAALSFDKCVTEQIADEMRPQQYICHMVTSAGDPQPDPRQLQPPRKEKKQEKRVLLKKYEQK